MDTDVEDLVENTSPGEKIAQSLVPYNRDDARARYLGLRSSGFAIREALRLIGKAASTLSLWRHDPQFQDLENRIPEFRRELSLEYANLEFLRNYRLVLEKDYRVIKKSLDKGIELTFQEQQYILKMRAHYTPQQLQIIEGLVGVPSGKEFNFTDLILTASRTQDTLRIETRNRSGSELSPLVDTQEEGNGDS